ncbi:hypothetical protein L195_g062733, partial [Trifolium pratense]
MVWTTFLRRPWLSSCTAVYVPDFQPRVEFEHKWRIGISAIAPLFMDRFRAVAACYNGNRLRYSKLVSNVPIRAL